MPGRIADPVVCNDPRWRDLLDEVVARGHSRDMVGVTPAGLPEGGYLGYRERAKGARLYLTYSVGGRSYTIGSVTPEYAASVNKPKPNSRKVFRFDSGPVEVRYDNLAMPCSIIGLKYDG